MSKRGPCCNTKSHEEIETEKDLVNVHSVNFTNPIWINMPKLKLELPRTPTLAPRSKVFARDTLYGANHHFCHVWKETIHYMQQSDYEKYATFFAMIVAKLLLNDLGDIGHDQN